MLYNVVEQLSAWYVFSNQIQLLGSFYDFVKLDNIWMASQLQNFNLSRHPLHVLVLHDFMFLKYFHRNFFTCQVVRSQLHFSKSTHPDSLAEQVVAYTLRLVVPMFFATFRFFMMPVRGRLLGLWLLFIFLRLSVYIADGILFVEHTVSLFGLKVKLFLF